jgi:hypothetical protein
MEYIITESKIHDVLNELIEKRFKGMVFRKMLSGSLLGFLPENIGSDDWLEDFTLEYEDEQVTNSNRKVLWVYTDDYDYFLSMVPVSEKEVNDSIKKWFWSKTKLKADLVYVQ